MRRFAILLAAIIWTYSVIFSAFTYLGKGHENIIKDFSLIQQAERQGVTPVEIDETFEKRRGIYESHWMPRWLRWMVDATLKWGWVGVPIAAILELLRKWLVNSVRDRQTERAIKKVIDHFYQSTKPPEGSPANYRVTLFRFRPFSFTQLVRWMFLKDRRPPWKGWLAPYERSGSHRNRTNIRWAASLENMSENKGVAGRVFRDCTDIRIENLPATDELRRSVKKRREYANEANCSEEWVLQKSETGVDMPRSFWGTTVEISGGSHPWGVLLIDSNLPDLIDGAVIDHEATLALKMLSIMLTPEKR